MKRIKLQARFFLAYLIMAALVLSVFALFFYSFVSKQLIAQETKSLSELTSFFKNQVDEKLEDLDSVAINIDYSSALKDKLSLSFDLDVSKDSLKGIAELFVTINGADHKADQINLYDFSGKVLKVGMDTNVNTISLDSIPWLEEVKNLDGKKLISTPFQTSKLGKVTNWSQWFVSLYRTYRNQYGSTVGAVETTKRCKSLFKNVLSYEKKTTNPPDIYIYNEAGALIYPYDLTEEEAAELYDYYQVLTPDNSHISFTNPMDQVKELVAYETSPYSNWTYVVIQPESVILKPVYQFLKMLLFVVCAMIAGCILISYYMSRRLIKPIKHLKHIIERIELDTLGDEKANASTTSIDELDELNQAFQNMSEHLKTSMNDLIDTRQQESKSRILALQSQINPHFYYNTLSSIIVLAENNQSAEVVAMCRNLTKIMRYITDGSSSNVTLGEEIDYITKYLYCMKVRYQSSLNYTVQVDESLLSIPIPKLLIQPLVENAIKYGTDCLPPWDLKVIGSRCKDYWKVDVIDSGSGFSEEAVTLITQRIEDATSHPGMPEIKIHGMGVLNVYLRWKLYAGDDIIFTYGNTEDGHGIVSIGKYTKGQED